MKRLFVLLSLVFLFVLSASAEKLSRTIEFDRYLMHARNAISKGDYRTAADNYERAAKLDTDPSESFYLDYSASLGALGRWKSAKAVLHTYFQHFDKQGKYYDLALRRYVEAEEKVERHSEERIRPELQGMGTPLSRPVTLPLPTQAPTQAPTWSPQQQQTQAPAQAWAPQQQAAVATRPLVGTPVRRQEAIAAPPAATTAGQNALERLIGLYSGESKEAEAMARSNNCDREEGKPHPAYDCFYGYHRNMSLSAIDGQAVVGFVKVDYMREHRSASNGDPREDTPATYRQMEYYLSIRLWVTPGGLIQGQQKPLCEFVVAEKVCTQTAKVGLTPLRAKMTPEGGLALESEKGGGPRVYTKVDVTPDVVRGEVVHVVPSLGSFMTAPGYNQDDRPKTVEAKPTALGDTAVVAGDEMDDLVAARFSAASR
jgi:tetratricopeptide (TPR) repeat protein